LPVTEVKRGLLDILKTMQEDDSTITLTSSPFKVVISSQP
jgi:hypothetical protein